MNDDEVLFHYEDYFGCDGAIPELNARVRQNGCISSFEDLDFTGLWKNTSTRKLIKATPN